VGDSRPWCVVGDASEYKGCTDDSMVETWKLCTSFVRDCTMLISMLKSAQALVRSNTFSNMYLRVVIEQLLYYKMKSMKFKIISTHGIYLHPKQSGIFMVSNHIIDLQRFNVYKFTFPMNRLSHSTMIQISLHSCKMTMFTRPP